jgi:hypothetical protein
MAFGDRFRRAINNIGRRIDEWFGGEQPGFEEEPIDRSFPPEEPPDEPPDEPPEPPEEPPEDGLVEVYDTFGNYVGTNTWEGWWNASLQKGGAYGLHTLRLIEALELTFDIDWPWREWREAYRQMHGV